MDHILASDAGWAMMQADCHRFMEFLVDMNNDMARDPDCDFFVSELPPTALSAIRLTDDWLSRLYAL